MRLTRYGPCDEKCFVLHPLSTMNHTIWTLITEFSIAACELDKPLWVLTHVNTVIDPQLESVVNATVGSRCNDHAHFPEQ
jgi:hypothetical protein